MTDIHGICCNCDIMGAHLNTSLFIVTTTTATATWWVCELVKREEGFVTYDQQKSTVPGNTIFSDWTRGKEHKNFYPTRGTQSWLNCGSLLRHGKAQITEYRVLYVGKVHHSY